MWVMLGLRMFPQKVWEILFDTWSGAQWLSTCLYDVPEFVPALQKQIHDINRNYPISQSSLSKVSADEHPTPKVQACWEVEVGEFQGEYQLAWATFER